MSDQTRTSLWSLLTTPGSDEAEDENHGPAMEVQPGLERSARRAYGVGYEWIFEPNKVAMEWPPSAVPTRCGGNFFWYGQDHLFRGVLEEDVESAMASWAVTSPQGLDDVEGGDPPEPTVGTVEEENYLELVLRIPQTIFDRSIDGILSPVEGIYDIIYYAAEYKYFLRHHRTTRGTLTLRSIPRVVGEEEDESGENVLQGTVVMDPQIVRDLDIVPHGGNFTFVETDRYQRVVRPKNDSTARTRSVHGTPTVAGVIRVWISEAPTGTFDVRYGRCTPNQFRGEFQQLRRNIALGLRRDCPFQWNVNDDNTARWSSTAVRNIEECMECNNQREETCLLWLRRHVAPSLPSEVLFRIQEFVSPPPYFILEEGDWVLSVDWTGGLPLYSATSCLVVRSRRSSGADN